MHIKLIPHGYFKEAMPKGHKRESIIYASTIEDIIGFLSQFSDVKELLRFSSFEIRVGKTLKSSRSLHVDELVKLEFPEGAIIHLCPFIGGNEITTAMLITAAISAAASIVVTVLMTLFFPMNTEDQKDDKKGVIYQGGLVVQKENEPLYYVAGLDVGCGGNLIEGDVFYMNGGEVGSSDDKALKQLIIKSMDGFNALKESLGQKGGGGKSIANTMVSNATLLALIAVGDGPIGGIIGDTQEEKEKNIYIARQPVRDHGTNKLTYQGIAFDERFGEEGQSIMQIVPGISNNVDGNVELPKYLSGGSQFYHTVTINNYKADKARVRLAVQSLIDTDNKKGNQKTTTIQWGINVKRQSSPTWVSAGTYQYIGKSSQPIVLERMIVAPPAISDDENDRWQFQIYRITEDSDTDRVLNATSFNGHVEIQSIDLPYDGSETSAPTALVGVVIDMEQFNQGGNYPEIMFRMRGRKVRVPTNYDPITRVYTGVWDGSWKTAATQNPVWHWFHIATESKQGLGFPDEAFNKYDLYQIARFNDENVNGRPRYTINTQFREPQDGWQFLVEFAASFRAFPYWDGQRVILVQDSPNQPIKHYINNTHVDNGFFNWQATELAKQYNEVLVKWNDPSDFFNEKTVRYRDTDSINRNRAAGMAAGGIIRASYSKMGCTNKQEAYDYARMLAYVSQNENETVTFDTLVNACVYRPGDLIEIDDIVLSHKQFIGRVAKVESNGLRFDYKWTQRANAVYTIHAMVGDVRVLRPVVMAFSDTETDFIGCDTTGFEIGTMVGLVEDGGAQPRVVRITNIEESDAGKFTVTGTIHIEGKYAWIEQNVPVPVIPYSDLKRNSAIPAPTGLAVDHSYSYDELLGASHKLSLNWNAITDPLLAFKGYRVECFKPDGQWYLIYEGMMNYAAIEDARPGKYVFTVKGINTFGASGDPAVLEYELEFARGGNSLNPPIFLGAD